MKKSFLSLILAVCLAGTLSPAGASAQQVTLPLSALSSLTHNCPNTAIMRPEAFDPLTNTYLLTVAAWVSRVTLSPVSVDPNAEIRINGVQSRSGEVSQPFEMTNEPLTVVISVTASDGSNSVYTVYLQRRPSSARTGVFAGFLTAIEQESDRTYLVIDLVRVTYQGDHVASFVNDNVPDRYRYPIAQEGMFFYNSTGGTLAAVNLEDFKAHTAADGTELFSIIYIRDEIVSIQPFSEELAAAAQEAVIDGFVTVLMPPDGSYALLREGLMGAPVIRLQQALKNRDFYKGAIDGLYGAGLMDAVKAFQMAYGLAQDGEAGADTQRLLYEGVYPNKLAQPVPAPEATPINSFVTVTAAPDGGMITLREGDEGALVKNLQQALKDKLFYKGEVDGFYGTGTRDAVLSFQKANNLSADGMAGIDTQSILLTNGTGNMNAPAWTPVPFQANVTPAPNGGYVTLSAGNIGALVISLQQWLKDQGYFPGEVDGIYGEETTAAVMKFQKDKGLMQDGEASPAMQLTLYEGKYPDAS